MAGKKGLSGRHRKPGRVYRFAYRFREGIDPPELGLLLESIDTTRGNKRADILRAALLGGSRQAGEVAAVAEDSETAELFDSMFEEF